MSTVIEVDDVWKKYRLGIIGTGTLRHDFERWWHRVRGKPDPYSKLDQKSEIRNQNWPPTSTIGSLVFRLHWVTTRCRRCGEFPLRSSKVKSSASLAAMARVKALC